MIKYSVKLRPPRFLDYVANMVVQSYDRVNPESVIAKTKGRIPDSPEKGNLNLIVVAKARELYEELKLPQGSTLEIKIGFHD